MKNEVDSLTSHFVRVCALCVHALQSLGILCLSLDVRPGYQASFAMAADWRPWI